MSFRSQAPDISRFTFGTGKVDDKSNTEHIAVTRAAMEAGVWFHTAAEYGGGRVFETLRAAFAQAPAQIPPCIFKVDGKSPDLLRATVEASLRGTGVERLAVAQVCGNPNVESLQPGGALHETMCELRDKGMVESYSLEIFWPFSANLLRAVAEELFDSVIFYLNVVEREVSNALYERLEAKQTPILALRTLGGGLSNGGRLDESARAALNEIYGRSGCADMLEFRVRFALSVPNVRTTIGATSRVEHLNALLAATRAFRPLDAGIVAQIQTLHRAWFADKGIS